MKTLIALKEVYNEDWKTAIAKKQEPIPKGAEVEFAGTLSNYYGYWWKVWYNASLYYVNPSDFKEKEEEENN